MKLARQADFDQIVRELLDDGLHSWEEAVLEAKETFLDSNIDIASLFLYQSKDEYDIKHQMEARYRILEDVASGKDTFVNMTFGLQGIFQTLRSQSPSNHISRGCKRMFEQRNGFHTVLKILKRISDEASAAEDDGDGKLNGEGKDSDSDEEDESENYLRYRTLLLEALLTILHGEFTAGQASCYRNIEESLMLSEEECEYVVSMLDEISDQQDRLVFGFLEFVDMLVKIRSNAELLVQASLVATMDLVKKLHKTKAVLLQKVEAIARQL